MKIIGALAALALIMGGWFVFVATDDGATVEADFAYVNGIYPGSPVHVLGVPVGSVQSVEPRGTAVRVSMTISSDVDIPADAGAYVMNPSVISDRFVELGPAYTGGPTLGDNVIPIERSRSPINWDQLLQSIGTIAAALGPEQGNLGAALDVVADSTEGLGPAMGDAIRDISQATAVVGGSSDEVGLLIENVDRLIAALAAREGAVASITGSLSELGQEIERQDLDIAEPIAGLKSMFDQLDRLLIERGADLRAVLDNTRLLTDSFAANEAQFAELMDVLPLMMQNIGNAIGEDRRARIRLNVSTDLDQFAVAVPLCRELALPICTGAGITNPIPLPLDTAPLGLPQVMGAPR